MLKQKKVSCDGKTIKILVKIKAFWNSEIINCKCPALGIFGIPERLIFPILFNGFYDHMKLLSFGPKFGIKPFVCDFTLNE